MSSLHKTNLEALAKKKSDDCNLPSYRDRAKERRQKYGQPNAPPINRLKVGFGLAFIVFFSPNAYSPNGYPTQNTLIHFNHTYPT